MGEPSCLAIPAGVRKIPTAITSPTINAAAVRSPICLFSSATVLERHARGELEGAGAAGAKDAPRRAYRLTKTRRATRSRIAWIAAVGNQHVVEARVVHVRDAQHVRHVEEIEHFRDRFNRKPLAKPESF